MCLAPGTVVRTLQTSLSERVVTWKVDVTSPSLQMNLKSEVEKDKAEVTQLVTIEFKIKPRSM